MLRPLRILEKLRHRPRARSQAPCESDGVSRGFGDERLALVLEVAGAGVFCWDAQSGSMLWDRRSRLLFDFDELAVDYSVWMDRVLAEDRGLLETRIRDAMQGDARAFKLRYRIRGGDGGLRHIATSALIFRDESGRAQRLEGVHLDVSALTRLQTREQVLVCRAERAEKANRAKSVFLANMSHELRTPLSAILGYAKILQRQPEKLQEGVRVIEESGLHLQSLIGDLLDLAKIEAGRGELKRQWTDLPALLRSLQDILSSRAAEKGLVLVQELDPRLPETVECDAMRLRQVLLNLLTNGVKFTERGRVILRVGLADGRRSGEVKDGRHSRWIRFSVIDTGIGFAPEQAESLFQPFEQGVEVRKSGEGSGLGLSISRHLVRLMGGDIHAQSQPGRGSRFSFEIRLPVRESHLARQPVLQVIGYVGVRRRILVVDDESSNRLVLRAVLEGVGFQVEEAAAGREALERVQGGALDLVLMDLMMPEMNGYETARRMHRLPGLAELPVIAVSAGLLAHGEQPDLCGFIAKPVQEEDLWQRIGRALGLHWLRGNPPAKEREAMPPPPPVTELQGLLGLARQGKIPRIRRRAEALQADYPAFSRRLLELAAHFQSEEIIRLLEGYRANEDFSTKLQS